MDDQLERAVAERGRGDLAALLAGKDSWTGGPELPMRTAHRQRHEQKEAPVPYVIAQPCVDLKDKACIDECPVDCIYEGQRSLYIHPDECVDCGACEPVCPVEAIFYEDVVPGDWTDYLKANVEFFDDLGSPGGASGLGPVERDHPLVAGQPVRTS